MKYANTKRTFNRQLINGTIASHQFRISLLTCALFAAGVTGSFATHANEVHGDFNNDGYSDLAVGVPGERVNGREEAGAVNVIYGASNGLGFFNGQSWHQGNGNVKGSAELADRFGSTVAAGDINGDGYDDLAIGVPNEDIGNLSSAGAVNVLFGSSAGLVASGDEIWHQDRPGVIGAAEPNDSFGRALSIGDYNNDGFGDLAIGVPFESLGVHNNAGGVHVLYGSITGLSSGNDDFWHQSALGLSDTNEASDHFGSALASGDIDGDGFDDLVVGVPNESLVNAIAAGAINVLYGSANGLSAAQAQFLNQDSPGIRGGAEGGDGFGNSVTTGDFDSDGFADVAVGVSSEAIGNDGGAGAVNVIYGTSAGLTGANDDFWSQDSEGVRGGSEPGDSFGAVVRAGDFNDDGYDDLAIGVPDEDLVGLPDVGAVNVLYGSILGITASNDDFWSQEAAGVNGAEEDSDFFGNALGVGDFDGNGRDDLAIGVPYEDVRFLNVAGAVNVLYGSNGGLTVNGNQVLHEDSDGVAETAESGDRFGSAL